MIADGTVANLHGARVFPGHVGCRQLPTMKAVYAIFDCEGRCLYVGASKNLCERWKSLKNSPWPSGPKGLRREIFKRGVFVAAWECEGMELLHLEQIMITSLTPTLNKIRGPYPVWRLRDAS